MDWTELMQTAPLQDQQGQIDQQLADVLATRRARKPRQFHTGWGALLGGLGEMLSSYKSGEAEKDLRQQRSDIGQQIADRRGGYMQELMNAQKPVQAPPAGIISPDYDPQIAEQERQQNLQQVQQAGMLSGDPMIGQYLQHAPQMELQQENLRKAQEERLANASPEAGLATRALLGKYGVNVGEKTPNATLRALLPTAEKGYGAEQAKESHIEAAKIGANARLLVADKSGGGADDAKVIGDAIIAGQQPPDLKGNYKLGPRIKAYLARQGYDLATAQTEWTATQKHMASLNGTQQERLRQGVDFANHSLDLIDKLYNDWQAVGAQTGIKMFNKASLAIAKQLPGDAGAAAQALDGQINDLTAELANVYMGGNSPTDHAISLAAQNLQSNWNEETFKKALGLIRQNLTLRKNSMLTSTTAGGSRYDAKPATGAAPQGAAAPGGAPAQAPAGMSHPQDSAAVQWAKQHPDDPRAKQILQINGVP